MRALSVASVLFLLGLLGCSHITTTDSRLIGKDGGGIVGIWTIDPEMLVKDPPGVPKGFTYGFSLDYRFEFRDNNTFRTRTKEGTYKLDGNKLTLTTTEVGGTELSKMGRKPEVETGEINSDGRSITMHPNVKNNPVLSKYADSYKDVKLIRLRR